MGYITSLVCLASPAIAMSVPRSKEDFHNFHYVFMSDVPMSAASSAFGLASL
jgi:hypothetical protein